MTEHPMTHSIDRPTIVIDGTEYIRKDSSLAASTPKRRLAAIAAGGREVVVIDRGWIFAGDVERSQESGDLTIYNAIHVFRWENIGYTGVLENPTSDKVVLKTCKYPVKVPAGSVIFTNPVDDNWGI